ncbi:sensor histidine kinase [Ruminococcus callidus]|uniref:sensor histidine kinase n=1 Tax=Ruminococcus callidus TaxID=40519 RepID=UPI003520151D
MEWLGWAFAAATALLLTIFIFLYLHQKQQAQHQHKKSQKALGKLENEMNRMQKELHHERDIIGLIQEHMVEGILILDDSDKIQLANRTATALLNIEQGKLGQQIHFHSDKQSGLSGRTAKIQNSSLSMNCCRKTSELHKGCSVRQLLKIDGKYIRAYITRVEMGGIFGTIVLLVDVTYNVKAEKMRQEFTANVSHELKTPLTTIKGFGEMFGSGMITKEEDVAKYGAMIERESERLLFLINDIIRLSEIEEHTEMLNTPVALEAAAKNALQILEPQIQRNKIHVRLEGDCLLLHSNEGYIRELFINLIDNAIKYNNPEGTVTITIQHLGTQAKIVIADNGIGIPLQAQSRIFERFYRVDKSRSKQRGGTGLGLSIVKHIVDCHNGTISLRSELGHGTEITILLPAK